MLVPTLATKTPTIMAKATDMASRERLGIEEAYHGVTTRDIEGAGPVHPSMSPH